MADCPKCGTEIGRLAYCGCGWKRNAKALAPSYERRCACCYEGCPHDAILKIQTPTGWANVCDNHYRIYHHAKAEKYCRDLGLDTPAKRLAWLKEYGKQIPGITTREPGEDWEELTAVDQA